MYKIQKLSLTLGTIFTVTISSTVGFAAEQTTTKVDMSRGDQIITPITARNIFDAKSNTKVDMQRNDQVITPVLATNIPDEKVNTKIDMQRNDQIITPVLATNIEE